MIGRLTLTVAIASAAPASAGLAPSQSIGSDSRGADVLMPLVGAGTWQYNDTVAYSSLCSAFAAGYSFVDTANGYGNQVGVGKAIKDCWKGPRSELFVMTKIPGGLNASEVAAAHAQNLAQLGLDYVDHLMTHFPADWDVTKSKSNPAARQEEWRALEAIYHRGEARTIGISHYCTSHIEDIMSIAKVTPHVNQVEYHVGSGDVDDVIETCKKYSIKFMSFSPLCGPCDFNATTSLLDGDLVAKMGAKHGKAGSQVSLRFIVQQALANPAYLAGVIPKSNSPAHLKANMDIFDFELDQQDMALLAAATLPAGTGGDCDVP